MSSLHYSFIVHEQREKVFFCWSMFIGGRTAWSKYSSFFVHVYGFSAFCPFSLLSLLLFCTLLYCLSSVLYCLILFCFLFHACFFSLINFSAWFFQFIYYIFCYFLYFLVNFVFPTLSVIWMFFFLSSVIFCFYIVLYLFLYFYIFCFCLTYFSVLGFLKIIVFRILGNRTSNRKTITNFSNRAIIFLLSFQGWPTKWGGH